VARFLFASTPIEGHSSSPLSVMERLARSGHEVSWLAGVDTPEELDKLNAINADAGYLEMIAAAGTNQLFEQGMSERVLLAKLP